MPAKKPILPPGVKQSNSVTSAPEPPKASSSRSGANALDELITSYFDATPPRLQLIDAFLVFLMLSGIGQFLYCLLLVRYPFNAFLAGFSSTIGQFVLLASLRSQVNPGSRSEFSKISPERAFADFIFGSVVLHFLVFNFLG
ncbi:uncharacterized protein L969DRAFT_97022 [Mixia osmundae IAM 14324]|uniref:Dolichyl-diphosphooligosaccharide--protein glycosyltransferase subunit OST2 n=1 Tax=Mixia osmundae (strain CBS 9802 / IAM 14324 / JCM 22182 / KY 12970) TaxID=764103 RepID=G7E1F6_MIXOS|nr:uncharacterized protein L969DRAFT_97022 [Mixia osmundae IAM 14324]KEI36620.1 hypothetical protein L969DRAFT_97022 [Mixia osmundae IAM 14324]GAA96666.1 hypothetical protein E5Q_03337 [Mixia osmundae IAM 14324]